MPKNISSKDVRNVGRTLAIGGRSGMWSDLDYAPLNVITSADDELDYADDVRGIYVKATQCGVMELDDADDTPDNAKSRAAARRYVLSSLLRCARKVHATDTLDLRARFADVPDTSKDAKPGATVRGFLVRRVK